MLDARFAGFYSIIFFVAVLFSLQQFKVHTNAKIPPSALLLFSLLSLHNAKPREQNEPCHSRQQMGRKNFGTNDAA
jgi:hypothetical protein